ncbi:hypothetical protein F1737_10785 [Methanoplanus sp. FWC-SCC4]|uniref:DUF2029 domain-containing protein n=1 Tax=Methanochimaera problematica TaxID=2609417 RepID=A0AA97FE07_9EURY|nr:hypothetical protein [Methanoplanus sp. FWC-SCC4]WOF17127.1 hypothetical protein F1737_10785 [Methanoplanus sp. FWC-SCC4]
MFDISIYLQYAVNIYGGQIPYVDFPVEYPVLFLIPVLLPLPFAVLTNDAYTYIYAYQIIMSVFDLFTLIFVYLISLKIFDKKTAFISGILYATAFSAAYFILTKFDSFPTFLLTLALMLTLYNKQIEGYISIILGFFTKIFPALAAPYIILYNSDNSDLKTEILKFLKYALPFGIILFIPLFLLNPEIINTYLFATGTSVGVYANTATYTISSILNALGLNISPDSVSVVMYTLMILTFIYLILTAFFQKIKEERRLLSFILLTIFSAVFFTKFHSPQYIVWMTPFFAILLAESLKGIIMFYAVQALAYAEFPLLFNTFYQNQEYIFSMGTSGWYTIVFFFTIEYLVLLVTILFIIKNDKGLTDSFKELPKTLVSRYKIK